MMWIISFCCGRSTFEVCLCSSFNPYRYLLDTLPPPFPFHSFISYYMSKDVPKQIFNNTMVVEVIIELNANTSYNYNVGKVYIQHDIWFELIQR